MMVLLHLVPEPAVATGDGPFLVKIQKDARMSKGSTAAITSGRPSINERHWDLGNEFLGRRRVGLYSMA